MLQLIQAGRRVKLGKWLNSEEVLGGGCIFFPEVL